MKSPTLGETLILLRWGVLRRTPQTPRSLRASESRSARRSGCGSSFLAATIRARAQAAQEAEAVDPGIVAVLPGGSDRVVADTLDVHQLVALEVEVSGRGRVPLAGGARTPAAQVVQGIGRDVAVVPGHHQAPRARLVPQLEGLGVGGGPGHAPVWPANSMSEIFQTPSSFTRR